MSLNERAGEIARQRELMAYKERAQTEELARSLRLAVATESPRLTQAAAEFARLAPRNRARPATDVVSASWNIASLTLSLAERYEVALRVFVNTDGSLSGLDLRLLAEWLIERSCPADLHNLVDVVLEAMARRLADWRATQVNFDRAHEAADHMRRLIAVSKLSKLPKHRFVTLTDAWEYTDAERSRMAASTWYFVGAKAAVLFPEMIHIGLYVTNCGDLAVGDDTPMTVDLASLIAEGDVDLPGLAAVFGRNWLRAVAKATKGLSDR